MQALAHATLQFEQLRKRFPTANQSRTVRLPQTKMIPACSWRVQLLPYIDQRSLYDDYDLMEPWDSETNAQLIDLRPHLFVCPATRPSYQPGRRVSHYLAIQGAKTVWPSDGKISATDVTDEPAQTILFVESDSSDVVWSEPRDLRYSEINWQLGSAEIPSQISSRHSAKEGILRRRRGGANMAFADGSTRFISETIDSNVLQAMVTANGGEVIDGN